MNAVLQCLFNIEKLIEILYADRPPESLSVSNITNELLYLAILVRSGRFATVSPTHFKTIVGEICPDFVGITKQHDAHELLLKILNRIDMETDKESGHSVMDLFKGALRSKTTCCGCSREYAVVDPFYCLHIDIPLEENTNLVKCIDKYMESVKIEKTCLQLGCNCSEAAKETSIAKPPELLMIQLKRFIELEEGIYNRISTCIEFPETLCVNEYDTYPSCTNYSLVSVINHYGSSITSGHYITQCVSAQGSWQHFDDDKSWSSDTVSPSGAYILIYKRSTPEAVATPTESSCNSLSCNSPQNSETFQSTCVESSISVASSSGSELEEASPPSLSLDNEAYLTGTANTNHDQDHVSTTEKSGNQYEDMTLGGQSVPTVPALPAESNNGADNSDQNSSLCTTESPSCTPVDGNSHQNSVIVQLTSVESLISETISLSSDNEACPTETANTNREQEHTSTNGNQHDDDMTLGRQNVSAVAVPMESSNSCVNNNTCVNNFDQNTSSYTESLCTSVDGINLQEVLPLSPSPSPSFSKEMPSTPEAGNAHEHVPINETNIYNHPTDNVDQNLTTSSELNTPVVHRHSKRRIKKPVLYSPSLSTGETQGKTVSTEIHIDEPPVVNSTSEGVVINTGEELENLGEEQSGSDDPTERYCICNTEWDHNAYYIGCDYCEEGWFHGSCVAIDESNDPGLILYMCPNCVQNNIDPLTPTHGELAEKLKSLHKQLSDRNQKIEKKDDKIIEEKNKSKTSLGLLKGERVSTKLMEDSCEKLEQEILNKDKEIKRISGNLEVVSKRCATLEKAKNSSSDKVSILESHVGDLEKKVKDLERELETHIQINKDIIEEIVVDGDEGNEGEGGDGRKEGKLKLTSKGCNQCKQKTKEAYTLKSRIGVLESVSKEKEK